ncbi:MAG: NAD(P)/FAD-dependent oxidoreductase, partial [Gemmatimonadota bacterium]
ALPFGALLLATGAAPVALTVPGAERPHVFTLRSLDDCRAIIRAAERAERAVVVGASFIGMEVAASLRARGLEVTVVAPEAVPFERTLGAEVGGALQRVHEDHGVSFRLGQRLAGIGERDVVLDDGQALPADVVVVGIGVRPHVSLAEAAGLAVDRGVFVDERLRTSAPAVFAAGDIARWPDPRWGRVRIEHWVVAQRQGQAAARSILGEGGAFRDVPFFWTQQFDFVARYVGHAHEWDEVVVDGDLEGGDAAIRYRVRGRTVAVATVGRDREALDAEVALERAIGRESGSGAGTESKPEGSAR